MSSAYYSSEKIYLTPFTSSNVLAAMQKAQRSSEPRLHGQIGLILRMEKRQRKQRNILIKSEGSGRMEIRFTGSDKGKRMARAR